MAIKIIFHFGLIYLLLNNAKTEETNKNVTCQLEKPLRKQIEAEPLNGRCLRDIVLQFAKALRTISNDELGITIFQEMLDKQEFVNISSGPSVKLKNLVDKLDNKLKSYIELLRQSISVIQQTLMKQSLNNYQSQAFQLNFVRNRVSLDEKFDVCSQISTGKFYIVFMYFISKNIMYITCLFTFSIVFQFTRSRMEKFTYFTGPWNNVWSTEFSTKYRSAIFISV